MTKCLFCDKDATIMMCQRHAGLIRFPQIHLTSQGDFPREYVDCLIENVENVVGVASYDGLSWRDDYDNYVASGKEPVYWIYLPTLSDLHKMFVELASGARKKEEK